MTWRHKLLIRWENRVYRKISIGIPTDTNTDRDTLSKLHTHRHRRTHQQIHREVFIYSERYSIQIFLQETFLKNHQAHFLPHFFCKKLTSFDFFLYKTLTIFTSSSGNVLNIKFGFWFIPNFCILVSIFQ